MQTGTFLILQTAAETDRALAQWANLMARDRFFELGRDPALVERIERELDQLNRRLRDAGQSMRLGQAPPRQIRSYCEARGELEKTADVVRAIRRQDRGSTHNTAQFLAQAERCRHQLIEIIDLLRPTHAPTLH